jgi:hypothetical protein
MLKVSFVKGGQGLVLVALTEAKLHRGTLMLQPPALVVIPPQDEGADHVHDRL